MIHKPVVRLLLIFICITLLSARAAFSQWGWKQPLPVRDDGVFMGALAWPSSTMKPFWFSTCGAKSPLASSGSGSTITVHSPTA